MDKYDFNRTKYGPELLIDLLRLENLGKYKLGDKLHTLSYYDITLITRGGGRLHLDEHAYPVKPNQVLFTTPGQLRKWEVSRLPEGLVLIFEEDFLATFFNDPEFIHKLSYFNPGEVPALCLSNEESRYFKDILGHVEEEISARSEKDDHILRALLYQALVWLNRCFQKSHSITPEPHGKHITRFRKLVNDHFRDHHDVAWYAGKLNITPGHLNALSREALGTPAKQYIQNRIFLEAKRLLLHSDLAISEIAWRLNFQDDSYFVRAFKSRVGVTPHVYRVNKNP